MNNKPRQTEREKSKINDSTAVVNKEVKHSSSDELKQRQFKWDPFTRKTSTDPTKSTQIKKAMEIDGPDVKDVSP